LKSYVTVHELRLSAADRYDVVAELSRGINMRRVARPDFVPTLTVQANQGEAANDDDSDSEQSYRYGAHETPRMFFLLLHFYQLVAVT
jgi:hypothetical protein